MIIKQLSVFVENRPGKMAEVLTVLQQNNVNLRALSVADTADFGILRLIVKDADQAACILRDANFTVKISKVLAIAVSDEPGGLLSIVNKLSSAGLNIEYMYAFASCDKHARVVFKVDNVEQAENLIANGQRMEPDFYW